MDAEIIEGASQMATEVVKDVYQDVAHPGLQSAGEVLGLVPRAVNAALVPLREWIEKREYRLASTKKLLEKKLEKVAPEEIVAPEIHIAVPALQAIGYSMDNEEVRDMYANLLASSMQKRVKNEVLPAYTEFIKQLSPDEARILRYIYSIQVYVPVVTLRSENKKGEGIDVVTYFTLLYRQVPDLEMKDPNKTAIFVDNLTRLQLLKIYDGNSLTDESKYHDMENDSALTKIKTTYVQREGFSWKYKKTFIGITTLGRAFCRVCITPTM